MESRRSQASDGLLAGSGIRSGSLRDGSTGNASSEPPHSNSTSLKSASSRKTLITPALKAWSFDLASCLIAVLALAAIVITLAIHKDDTLPSWPLGITINALISVFAVIFKVSLLVPVAGALSQLKWSWFKNTRPLSDLVDFDDASRGNVWSSVLLIAKTKGIQIPALGALIMITAIAVDPFIQQVVRYEPCPQPSWRERASVARTNNYTASGIHTGAMQQSLDAPMQAAVYKGVYQAWSPVSPVCTTGNCTFPNFRSVAMCGHCQNITDEIQYTPNLNRSFGSTWMLASGLSVGYGNPYVLNMTSTKLMDPASSLLTTETIAVTNYTAYSSFYNPDPSDKPNNKSIPATLWQPPGQNFITAARCSMQPCIRTIAVQVNSSNLTETTLDTHAMTQGSWSGGPSYSWAASPMPCLLNGSYFDASAFTESNATNATNRWPTQGLLPDNQTAWLPDECYFRYLSTLGLVQYLDMFLSGYMAYAPETQFGSPAFIEQLWHTDLTGQETDSVTGSSFEQINSTWTSLVDSMSAHIREAGDTMNSAPSVGVTFQMQTCVRVRWQWLSYPIALLFLTITLFLVTATAAFGRRTTHQLWRDSPLALLFHGLEDKLRGEVRSIEQKQEMGKMAKKIYVKLVDEGDGAEFRQVGKEEGPL